MKDNRYHTYHRFRDKPDSRQFGEVAQITTLVIRPYPLGADGLPLNAAVDHWNVAVSRRTGRMIDTSLHAADYNSLTLYFHQLTDLLPARLRPEAEVSG